MSCLPVKRGWMRAESKAPCMCSEPITEPRSAFFTQTSRRGGGRKQYQQVQEAEVHVAVNKLIKG